MKKHRSSHDLSHAEITALRISEERLNRSQQFANIGTWDWNITNGDLYWSDRIWPLFGYDKEVTSTSYDSFIDAVHPDDRQDVLDAVNNCVEKGVNYSIEHRVVWPDGSVHWVQEDGDVVRTEDGKPSHMLGVVQDIDTRKRAELALANNEQQLLEAQKIAHIGSWQADLISGGLIWSDEIYRIFGHKPGSFEPSVQAFHAAVHPDDLGLVHESEKRSEKTGRHDVVHRIVQPDHTVRYVHELARAETDAAGNLVRLIGTVQDVTEQVNTEHALLSAKEEAEKANAAMSTFLSSMSHELRTPLNAILGFGQLLNRKTDDQLTESDKDYIKEILNSGNLLLELINDILDLSRIEAGHIDVTIENIHLNEVLSQSITMLQGLIDQGNIRLNNHIKPDTDYIVHVDGRRFKQVILNLLSNAVKYNRENGEVRLSCQVLTDGYIRVLVEDTGLGIDDEYKQHIFKPFVRAAINEVSVSGTGIGLVITKSLIEAMGGKIGFESEIGQGSSFWLDIPLARAVSI